MCVCVFAVKVVLVPDGHVMTMAFPIRLSIQDLKCLLASELRVPAEVLRISLDGTEHFLCAPARRALGSLRQRTSTRSHLFIVSSLRVLSPVVSVCLLLLRQTAGGAAEPGGAGGAAPRCHPDGGELRRPGRPPAPATPAAGELHYA